MSPSPVETDLLLARHRARISCAEVRSARQRKFKPCERVAPRPTRLRCVVGRAFVRFGVRLQGAEAHAVPALLPTGRDRAIGA